MTLNIKRAKEEIKNTIAAYQMKDAYGAYEIPPEACAAHGPAGDRQDSDHGADLPGVPGGAGGLYHYPPHQAERHRASFYPGPDLQLQTVLIDRVLLELDRGFYLL